MHLFEFSVLCLCSVAGSVSIPGKKIKEYVCMHRMDLKKNKFLNILCKVYREIKILNIFLNTDRVCHGVRIYFQCWGYFVALQLPDFFWSLMNFETTNVCHCCQSTVSIKTGLRSSFKMWFMGFGASEQFCFFFLECRVNKSYHMHRCWTDGPFSQKI